MGSDQNHGGDGAANRGTGKRGKIIPIKEDGVVAERDADLDSLEVPSVTGPSAAGEADSSGGSSDGQSSNDQGGSAEIAALKAEVDSLKDKYLRSLAEFENYKKRVLKERSELIKYQGERIFQDLVEVADNFEFAMAHKDADPGQVKEGLVLIHKRFFEILAKWEVRPESAVGKDFDPYKHRALSKVVLDDTKPGTVVNELRQTYLFKDKVLRPGEVVVAAAREVEASAAQVDSQTDSAGDPSEGDKEA